MSVVNPLMAYSGQGSSAIPSLVRYMLKRGDQGANLSEATKFVMEETKLSNTTVWKAWLVLLDLELIIPTNGDSPRIGRHRERHIWKGGGE